MSDAKDLTRARTPLADPDFSLVTDRLSARVQARRGTIQSDRWIETLM